MIIPCLKRKMEAKEKCSSWFLRSLAVRAIQLTVAGICRTKNVESMGMKLHQ